MPCHQLLQLSFSRCCYSIEMFPFFSSFGNAYYKVIFRKYNIYRQKQQPHGSRSFARLFCAARGRASGRDVSIRRWHCWTTVPGQSSVLTRGPWPRVTTAPDNGPMAVQRPDARPLAARDNRAGQRRPSPIDIKCKWIIVLAKNTKHHHSRETHP